MATMWGGIGAKDIPTCVRYLFAAGSLPIQLSLHRGWSRGCQRFWLRAEDFACFVGDVTLAVGTITLCTGITAGCAVSIPSC
jgi:hypothetical protein